MIRKTGFYPLLCITDKKTELSVKRRIFYNSLIIQTLQEFKTLGELSIRQIPDNSVYF
jgi:hypothetical protein